ncbi:MAG: FapA family protein [bacterium]
MVDENSHRISRDVKNETLEFSDNTPVVIDGSVSGATIVTEGDLALLGLVENSELVSKKEHIFLKVDIEEGTKQTQISAGKNVYIKSAKDVLIKAGKTIFVEHSLLDSQAAAGDRVLTETDLGAIAGGKIVASERIVGCDIGDASGTPTLIQVEDPFGIVQGFCIHPNVTIRIGDIETVTDKKQTLVKARVEGGKIQFDPIEPPSKGLMIGRSEEGGKTVLHLHGRLDGHTVEKFEKALGVIEGMRKLPVLLDLHEVTYLSSVAIRIFIDRIKKLGKENFVLANPSPAVVMVVRMTGLADVFGLH